MTLPLSDTPSRVYVALLIITLDAASLDIPSRVYVALLIITRDAATLYKPSLVYVALPIIRDVATFRHPFTGLCGVEMIS